MFVIYRLNNGPRDGLNNSFVIIIVYIQSRASEQCNIYIYTWTVDCGICAVSLFGVAVKRIRCYAHKTKLFLGNETHAAQVGTNHCSIVVNWTMPSGCC